MTQTSTPLTTHMIGDLKVTLLTDGTASFPPEFFPAASEEVLDQCLKAVKKDAIETNFNALLVETGAHKVLVDAGPRDLMGPTAGGLQTALKAAGCETGDITHLVLTHLHPDHVAGTIAQDGTAVFSNAAVYVNDAERAFWGDMSNFTGNDMLIEWAGLAGMVMTAYGDQVQSLSHTQDIISGVSVFDLQGHTPGHMGVRVSSGSEDLLHLTDLIHAPDIQLKHPEFGTIFDVDPETAKATRKRALDQAAQDKPWVTGGHFSHGIGRISLDGDGYKF
ncbi:MAG: MBL fold metallo-hydrolase [Halocynthiibacter sp.]